MCYSRLISCVVSARFKIQIRATVVINLWWWWRCKSLISRDEMPLNYLVEASRFFFFENFFFDFLFLIWSCIFLNINRSTKQPANNSPCWTIQVNGRTDETVAVICSWIIARLWEPTVSIFELTLDSRRSTRQKDKQTEKGIATLLFTDWLITI